MHKMRGVEAATELFWIYEDIDDSRMLSITASNALTEEVIL